MTAVEPEPRLRALAVQPAVNSPGPVTVVAGTAETLPLPDTRADAAVLCLVMCSLPDRAASLAEVARLTQPATPHVLGIARRPD